MAKISDGGLRLTLDEGERARVERDLIDSIDPVARSRAGFARRECIGGKHALGTDPDCRVCAQYKAGARVRKG